MDRVEQVETNQMLNAQRGAGQHVIPPPQRQAPPLCPSRNAPMTDPYHKTVIPGHPLDRQNLANYQ
jgi:hypothetical protein